MRFGKPQTSFWTGIRLVLVIFVFHHISTAQLVNTDRRPVENPESVKNDLFRVNQVDQVILGRIDLDGDEEDDSVISWLKGDVVGAYVLDRVGGKWFQVAELRSWAKYETSPLETFVTLMVVVQSHGSGQHNFFAVRDSGGGTGLYYRDMVVYRVRNSQLIEVLRVSSERFRDCSATIPPGKSPSGVECHVVFKEVRPTVTVREGRPAIEVNTFEGNISMGDPRLESVQGGEGKSEFPLTRCEYYVWDETEFQFVLSGEEPRSVWFGKKYYDCSAPSE